MKEVNSSRSNLISSDDENENIDGKPVGGCRRILTGGNKINLSTKFPPEVGASSDNFLE